MGSCRLFIKAHKTHKEVTQSNSSDICPFWWRLEASFAYEWTHLPVNVIMVQSKLYLVIISGFSHYQIKSEMNLTWPCLPQYSQRPWHCWTMFFSSELIPRGPPPPHPHPPAHNMPAAGNRAQVGGNLLLNTGCICRVWSSNCGGLIGYTDSKVGGQPADQRLLHFFM